MLLAPTKRDGCREARAGIDVPPCGRPETVSADRRSEDRGKRPARDRRRFEHGQLGADSMLRDKRHAMGHHDVGETNGALAGRAAAIAALMVDLMPSVDLACDLAFGAIRIHRGRGPTFVMHALAVSAACTMSGHAYRHRTGAPQRGAAVEAESHDQEAAKQGGKPEHGLAGSTRGCLYHQITR